MFRILRRRLTPVVVAVLAASIGTTAFVPATAAAHNSLISSDPAEGAVLTTAPTQVTWLFDKSVPLDTMTVTLIDASGARTELSDSRHGASGDAEVVTPLPPLQPGTVSVRWRLVGADGHAITGRLGFTVSGGTGPATGSTVPGASIPPVDPETTAEGADDSGYSVPPSVRWLLRYASYLAILTVIGILLTSALVWPELGSHAVARRLISTALATIAVLGAAQLMVLASDIRGTAPWSSFGSIDAATSTAAGMALALRVVLAAALWLVACRARITHSDIYRFAAALPALGLLATWAFAGHSRSMRWPVVGVANDVVHHAAAAVWIGGLAVVGWATTQRGADMNVVQIVRRFSGVAAAAVAALVATGVVQSIRLVGNPLALFDADHGRILAMKLVALGAMLALARGNRRRVGRLTDDTARQREHIGTLRRAVAAEFAIGLVIVGLTAALVVATPSTGTTEGAAASGNLPSSTLHTVVVTPERLSR